MARNSCVYIPDAPNGKESILFKELQARIKDRDVLKMIWAFTQTEMFTEAFPDLKKDENGEVTYEALDEVLGLSKFMNDYGKDNALAITTGVTTLSGRPQRFKSSKEALDAVRRYNKDAKKTVAVIRINDDGTRSTEVLDRNPMNIAEADRTEARESLNDMLVSLLNRLGFDVAFMDDPNYEAIFDPLHAEENAQMLKEIIKVSRGEKGAESLPEEVAHLVLAGLENHPIKKRIDALFTQDVVRSVLGNKYRRYERKYRGGRTPLAERLRDEAEGKVLADILKGKAIELSNNTLNITQNEYTNEFRRIQAESKGLSDEEQQRLHSESISDEDRRRIGDVLRRLLGTGNNGSSNDFWFDLSSSRYPTDFRFSKVNGTLFHDVFEVVRTYLKNGELVDLHENYDNCKCFLSDDGLCGFAIEPDGNLISVFSLNPSDRKGFLYAISDFIKEQGATHLDAFASSNQDLSKIYEKTLGFQVASRMEFNEEYDESGIGEKHDNPDVVFMVLSDNNVKERNFDKNSYDAASNYQQSQVRGGSKFSIDSIVNLLRRLWNSVMSMFRNVEESDIDNLVANARNELESVADMMLSGDIEPILDKESIMQHEFLNDLNEDTNKEMELGLSADALLSQRLSILEGTNPEADSASIRQAISDIRNDLEKERYESAILRALLHIGKEISDIQVESKKLGFVHNKTIDLGMISYEADLVKRMGVILEGYAPYIAEIQDLETLVRDGEINLDADKVKALSERASKYKKAIENLNSEYKKLRFSVLKNVVSLFYGDNGKKPDTFTETDKTKWQSVDTILHSADRDISFWDTTVFSAGDSRNPLINVIHNIVVSQQAERDNRILRISARLTEAQEKLQVKGYENKFVCQFDENGIPTGYYVGPVDMARFVKAREQAFESINDNEDLDAYAKMRAKIRWEEENMEEIEVGPVIGPRGERRKELAPKKSIYGTPDYDKGWSDEQKEYYKLVLELKAEMDSYLPPSMRGQYLMPQVRKSLSQMFDKDSRGALATMWGDWKSKYTITADNMNYGDVGRSGILSDKEMLLDFKGKPVKRVPVYFIHELDDKRDLSTDGTHALLCYIAMAVNYNEMSKLANAMTLMQDYVNDPEGDRKGGLQIKQNDAGRPIVGWFRAMGKKFKAYYTESGSGTNIAKAINEYVDRTFFNETKKKLGNVANPFKEEKPFSIDNALSVVLRLTSVSRMGLNVLSGITNVTQGETQMLEEAAAERYFNMKAYGKAKQRYFKLLGDYAGQFNSVNRHDLMSMLINQFNSGEDFFREIRDKNFSKNPFKRVLGKGNIMFLNTAGEHYLHTCGMLSVLEFEKVKVLTGDKKGKTMSLYDAIERVHDENGWHLELVGDLEFMNKRKPFLISNKYKERGKVAKDEAQVLFTKMNTYINNINAGMHGGYSEAEKGNMNRNMLMQFVNQFRQWMWGMYNKLYSGSYYDAVMMVQKEGAYRSIMRFITGTIYDLKNMSLKEAFEHNKMTPEQQQNARVAYAQAAIFCMLIILCSMTMGWKDDDKRSARLLSYSFLRLRTETGALVPWPSAFFKNVFTLVQSPAAAVNTLETVTTLLDLNSYWNEIGSGRFKGWHKAAKAAYTLTPVYNIGKLIDMKDYNYMFNLFN